MDEVRLRYIKDTIDQLPKGNITYKTIHGKKYPYYQWQENGKQRGRRVKDEELEELTELIKRRKVLQEKLKESGMPPKILEEEYFYSLIKM